MTRAEQAAALLQRVQQLAEEHGPALKRAHTLLVDGALVGPAAERLHKTLTHEHNDVRSAFYTAFDAVERLAAEAGPPRTQEPYIPAPPRSLPSSPSIRSGSPEALDHLSTELTRAANSWEDAAQALSEILANLALSTAPATTIARAASHVSHQRAQVRRSREELLKTVEHATQPPDSGGFFTDGWNAYAHHYLPGLGQGLKDLGLSALAGNPATAPLYIAAKPKSWLERGPVGQVRGLIEGVRHPTAFAKAIVNWEEWKRDPARALGETAPSIIITVATLGVGSGSGIAARMAGGVRRIGTKTPETATSARALEEAATEARKTDDLTRRPPTTPPIKPADPHPPSEPPPDLRTAGEPPPPHTSGGPPKKAKPGLIDESDKIFDENERRIAELLTSEGSNVKALPESRVDGVRTPDALVDGTPVEFKSLANGATLKTVKNTLNSAKGQSPNAILDGRGTGLTKEMALDGIELFLRHNPGRMTSIRVLGDGYDITWPRGEQ